ncbi:MAG TPA: hypothetical protein VNE39_28400 [Planctomycetota bacterium]|nr:hypothetical protein [Planctomycetota bacterium]
MFDTPWHQILILGAGVILLTAPFILSGLVRRCEARAAARGELEPSVGEWMLRALLVLSVLLMLFTPIIVLYVALLGANFD